MMGRPIVIAAGGTGGHFFPAEALAAALVERGERVVLMTDARSAGLASPIFAETERYVVAGAGLAGRGVRRAVPGAAALLRGVFQARRILALLRPRALVAFGGYPAVPPVVAARLLRHRPVLILHEQNAVLGRANRLLAKFCDRLVLSFEHTARVPSRTLSARLGNPVRPALAVLRDDLYVPPTGLIEILVLGGSLGAKIFGTLIPAALALLPADLCARLHVVQQCRDDDMGQARTIFMDAGIAAELSAFFNDVAARVKTAHLVIARAGASTVAELAVAGKPAIFIPLPNAIDDHQRANADALQRAGAAWRLDQVGLTPQSLATKIEMLLRDSKTLESAARAAHAAGRPFAAEELAGLVVTMANRQGAI